MFDEEVSRVADRIECGHLLAATSSAGFMGAVADKIEELENEVAQLRHSLEAVELDKARIVLARDEAEAEVWRLLDELSNAVDGHWDAEPSWYADKVLSASPYTGQ